MSSAFKAIGNVVSQAAPIIGTVAGLATGNPALASIGMAAGQAGSLFGGGNSVGANAMLPVYSGQGQNQSPTPGMVQDPSTGMITNLPGITPKFADENWSNPSSGADKAQKLQSSLMSMGAIYGKSEEQRRADELEELARAKIAGDLQAQAYRPAPNPQLVGASPGSLQGVGGGFTFGR